MRTALLGALMTAGLAVCSARFAGMEITPATPGLGPCSAPADDPRPPAKPSSLAPRGSSHKRVYGAPIQKPIVSRTRHRRHAPPTPSRSGAPTPATAPVSSGAPTPSTASPRR
jgi:hypothetical protein